LKGLNIMRRSNFLVLGLGVAALLMLGGCWSKGQAAYKSRPFQPTTITVVDATTFEAIWTYDIPVGYTLKINYEPSNQTRSPKVMKWALYEGDDQDLVENYPTGFASASGKVKLPGGPIKTDITLRRAPELPGSSPPEIEATPPTLSDDQAPAEQPAQQDTSSVDEAIRQEVQSAEQAVEQTEQPADDEAAK
jgi:hypothetical protein